MPVQLQRHLLTRPDATPHRKGWPGTLQGSVASVDINNPSEHNLDACLKEWLNILDKMIYGFSEEPDISHYDVEFDHNILDSDEDYEGNTRRVMIKCLTPDRLEDYRKACKEHQEKALEGRLLFAQYFNDLWW